MSGSRSKHQDQVQRLKLKLKSQDQDQVQNIEITLKLSRSKYLDHQFKSYFFKLGNFENVSTLRMYSELMRSNPAEQLRASIR